MSVDAVFKLLKSQNTVGVSTGLKFDTLDEFILFYNRAKKAEETLIGVLTRGFGSEGRLFGRDVYRTWCGGEFKDDKTSYKAAKSAV
ncbi:hypothetical protein JG688_00008865 [Phytophthora aleatoria]|uniref:Uncharacterized protein n=1 Tax=Phytophthora aleatoria TaxID=2496075 RepID=A0A8J5M722_9STRA|nr:hypothetical protein JG688_00008865 [Phytophthora aleatoria]